MQENYQYIYHIKQFYYHLTRAQLFLLGVLLEAANNIASVRMSIFAPSNTTLRISSPVGTLQVLW